MGGYSRHKVAYNKSGWAGLHSEIQLDVGRISKRNLGRDCRIIGDHGKEVRFPYLDENVFSFLTSLPIYSKVDPRIEGDLCILI
jgi:asparagine synthetase B (glutamine-hydrolysing)